MSELKADSSQVDPKAGLLSLPTVLWALRLESRTMHSGLRAAATLGQTLFNIVHLEQLTADVGLM